MASFSSMSRAAEIMLKIPDFFTAHIYAPFHVSNMENNHYVGFVRNLLCELN